MRIHLCDGKKDARGNTIPKLTGFDSTYVIVRIDLTELWNGVPADKRDASYLHVTQDKNNALLVAVGMNADATKANKDGRDQWGNMSFSNLFSVTGADGKATGTQYMRKTASYKLSEMYDTSGKDTATPYFDVILFSSAGLVAGADAQKEGALTGDVELSFYVDQAADYNTSLNWDPQSTDTTLPAKCLAKFYDEDKAKAASAKISRYTVKGSDLRLETMVDNSDDTGSKTTFWSLSKSMQKPHYNQDIDKSASDPNCGRIVKLMCEVPVVDNLELVGASATELKKRTLDVNSFDIQVANNTSQAEGLYTSGLALKHAWLKIMDSNETTGAELAIGNNATMTIDEGGKMIVDKTCQLEIEWDGATTSPATEGQPAATPDILNNGSLDLRAGGEIQNDGVVTIEGTEVKPYQEAAADTARESSKGHGELTIEEGATFTNNGCFMSNGSLYVQGKLVNNGKYADTLVSNDPDKGQFTYHKGIQSTWKDDVTQSNIIYGGIYVGLDKTWSPKAVDKAVLENNGDIVLCPGELVNAGTVKNNAGAHIYSCATDEAIIPIEPDPNNPTVVTKKVTFDSPKGSFINNYTLVKDRTATIENNGRIEPAHVTVEESGSLGKLEVDNVADKFKDCFVFFSTDDSKVTGSGFLYKHDISRAKIEMMMGPTSISSVPYDGYSWKPDISAKMGNEYYYESYGDFTIKYQDPSGKEITDGDMVDAGTYKIILGEGQAFTGEVAKTLTIEPAVLAAATLDSDAFTYDGEVHKPVAKSVSAKGGDMELTVPESGYKLSYSTESPVDAGTYTVTITGTGNYTGFVAKAFTIAQPAPAPSPTPTPAKRTKITAVELDADSFAYDGREHKPAVTSVKAGNAEVPASGYSVSYSSYKPTEPGEYLVTVEGRGDYEGAISKQFTIVKEAPVVTRPKITEFELDADAFTYDGIAHKPEVKSVKAGSLNVGDSGYSVGYSAENSKGAGKYAVTVTGKGNYAGSIAKPYKIGKAENTLALKGKTAQAKKADLAKKDKTFKRSALMQVSKAKGAKTYKLESVNKAKFKKYFKVNAKTGNVIVKKGLAKGTYAVKVKVTAAGTANYAAVTKAVTCKVKITG